MPYDWYPFSTVASLFSLLVRKVRELNKLRLFDDTYSIWESEDPCNCLGALCHRYLCLAGAKEKKLLHVAVLGYRGRRDLVNQSSLADAAQKYVRRKYDPSPGYAGRAALVTPVCDQPRSQGTPQKNKQLGVWAITVTMTSPATPSTHLVCWFRSDSTAVSRL